MANWTREQTIVAFNVYCKIPFKESKASHPLIVEYASIIGRSPAALNMKIGNFGRLDPALAAKGITGLSNGSKLDELIWNEFNENWETLAFESERLIAEFKNSEILDDAEPDEYELGVGIEREQLVKARVNQSFFRSAVLTSYEQKCCISGLSIPSMLIASHIIPWKDNVKERVNPRNGLCLNAIHDKAFDKGYITITTDHKVKLSPVLKELSSEKAVDDFFIKFEDKKISLPDRFLPDKDFLDYHNKNIFLS